MPESLGKSKVCNNFIKQKYIVFLFQKQTKAILRILITLA